MLNVVNCIQEDKRPLCIKFKMEVPGVQLPNPDKDSDEDDLSAEELSDSDTEDDPPDPWEVNPSF